VQRRHRRLAQQVGDHLARAVAFHQHPHPGADALGLRLRFEAHGVAHDHLRVFELAQPVGDGAARDPELVRQVGHREAGVLPQQGDELLVQVIHGENGNHV
jgi:hypothetical protein